MSNQRVHDLARKVKTNIDAAICAAAGESDLSEAALDLHVQLMIDIGEILVLSDVSASAGEPLATRPSTPKAEGEGKQS